MKAGNLNFLETSGPLQACKGNALPLHNVLRGFSYGDNYRTGKVVPDFTQELCRKDVWFYREITAFILRLFHCMKLNGQFPISTEGFPE